MLKQVWFRQGVNGDKLFWDAKAATGSAWVLMVGEMIHIGVSANDQVQSCLVSCDSHEDLQTQVGKSYLDSVHCRT